MFRDSPKPLAHKGCRSLCSYSYLDFVTLPNWATIQSLRGFTPFWSHVFSFRKRRSGSQGIRIIAEDSNFWHVTHQLRNILKADLIRILMWQSQVNFHSWLGVSAQNRTWGNDIIPILQNSVNKKAPKVNPRRFDIACVKKHDTRNNWNENLVFDFRTELAPIHRSFLIPRSGVLPVCIPASRFYTAELNVLRQRALFWKDI